MRNGRLRSAFLIPVLCSAFVFSSSARADTPPSAWDIARDPSAHDRWTLHVRAQRLIHAPLPEGQLGLAVRDAELHYEAARALLEEAHVEHAGDVRLRIDLGVVYERLASLQHRRDLYRRVVEVLAPAIEAAPDDPYTTEALGAIVYAYANLDRPRDELATWRRYIARLDNDRERIVPLMNMGEAEMRLGQIDDALATFRDVLRICGTLPNGAGVSSTYVLTLWDVAVALDRSGDPRGALDSAAEAIRMAGHGPITSDPNVFYVPEWEREWYLAIAAAADARSAGDARDAARSWRQAETHWDTYATKSAASGAKDPWIAIARVRRDHAHVERVAAEKRAAKLPPPRADDDETRGRPWSN